MATEIELLGGVDEDDDEEAEQELIPYVSYYFWLLLLSFTQQLSHQHPHPNPSQPSSRHNGNPSLQSHRYNDIFPSTVNPI